MIVYFCYLRPVLNLRLNSRGMHFNTIGTSSYTSASSFFASSTAGVAAAAASARASSDPGSGSGMNGLSRSSSSWVAVSNSCFNLI